MNRQAGKRSDSLCLAIGILTIIFLGWLCSERFAEVERLIAVNFLAATAQGSGNIADQPLVETVMNILCLSVFSFCAVVAPYKIGSHSIIEVGRLKVKVRLVVLLQLVALNVVLHLLLALCKYNFAMPLSLVLVSTVGTAYGALVARAKDLRTQLETKEEAVDLISGDLNQSLIQIIKDEEIDRRTLAGDLHDQVLNDLKLIREKLLTHGKAVAKEGEPNSSAANREEIDKLIVHSMQEIREVMDNLSPAVLQHLHFTEAVEDCVRKGAERSGYKVRFRCNLDRTHFDSFSTTELSLLYRLVQESVTNICKHAGATTVKCTITADGDTVRIAINDNGKGIDKNELSKESRGLRYMRQRASIIGARVAWLPGDDGVGTKVEIAMVKPKQL